VPPQRERDHKVERVPRLAHSTRRRGYLDPQGSLQPFHQPSLIIQVVGQRGRGEVQLHDAQRLLGARVVGERHLHRAGALVGDQAPLDLFLGR
jgi:hypothetical protein